VSRDDELNHPGGPPEHGARPKWQQETKTLSVLTHTRSFNTFCFQAIVFSRVAAETRAK